MDDVVARLALLADRHTHEGLTSTPIANMGLLRMNRPCDLLPEVYRPVVSLIVQGEKELTIGSQVLTYRAGDTFTATLDLPVRARITCASSDKPYLAISLAIDIASVLDLASLSLDTGRVASEQGFGVHRAGADLLGAYDRALDLLDRSGDAVVMAPLLERELLYRLLAGAQGAALNRLATGERHVVQVRSVLELIGRIYKEPFSAKEIARTVGMSVSALHRRFKAATGMAPLQYQKTLRLYEARRLLLENPVSASSVAFTVGYESASQFTREYRRMFGAPPARDVRNMALGWSQNSGSRQPNCEIRQSQ